MRLLRGRHTRLRQAHANFAAPARESDKKLQTAFANSGELLALHHYTPNVPFDYNIRKRPSSHTSKMPITILQPQPPPPLPRYDVSSDEDDILDDDGDVEMERGAQKARISSRKIVTPGEVVTEDPQWMR